MVFLRSIRRHAQMVFSILFCASYSLCFYCCYIVFPCWLPLPPPPPLQQLQDYITLLRSSLNILYLLWRNIISYYCYIKIIKDVAIIDSISLVLHYQSREKLILWLYKFIALSSIWKIEILCFFVDNIDVRIPMLMCLMVQLQYIKWKGSN